MKISYNWLCDYLKLASSPVEVASVLTSIGLEVGGIEEVESIRGGLAGLVVGEVVECEPHPNSDHLHVTRVRIDEDGEPLQIVCGASNVQKGQKVVVATVGTVLYDGDKELKIKPCKLRGVDSFGMLCAEDEIQVGDSHEGIIVLPSDVPVGTLVKDYYKVQADTVFEIDITPNRSDAISHYGVARDLYAYFKLHAAIRGDDDFPALVRPSVDSFKVALHDSPMRVTVENSSACPRYSCVCLSGISVKESPQWLKDRLMAIGLKPINNVVDVANFVMFEMGQPLHTFDADKIENGHVIIKNAKEGEEFVTLDGVKRTLSANNLTICDERGAMCIAGVFGGIDSGITDKTKRVFIESAYFDPVSIRKTARQHGLSTDASFRYERGCDPNNTLFVLKRCATLIQACAGGQVSSEIIDIVNGKEEPVDEKKLWFAPFTTTLNLQQMWKLVGDRIDERLIECALNALEIDILDKHTVENTIYQVAIPRYRTDVQRECDVVEDILRLYGYNNIPNPSKLNTCISYSAEVDPFKLQERISEQLAAQGFTEILNNSLTKSSYYNQAEMATTVRLLNPLSSDLNVMRQTLLWGGLESISRNIRFKNTNLRFFEFGKCYHFDPSEQFTEEPHLGLWITGNKRSASWVYKDERVSFYQMHAFVNLIFQRLGIEEDNLIKEGLNNTSMGLHFTDGLLFKDRQNRQVAYIGIVSKDALSVLDIDQPVYFADILWERVLQIHKNASPIIKDLPKYPFVKRDLSLLLPRSTHFEDLKKLALATEKRFLKDLYLFDVYEGKNIDPDKKSYAITFILQDEENTLVDSKIEAIMARIQHALEDKFNAVLRG